jgi:glycosyltransferase involved in cell wall biosynthesis
MGRGCAIIATPVGDIPLHVKPGVNGWLFTTVEDEDRIIREGVDYLREAIRHGQTLNRMGRENITHAREYFGLKTFERKWRELVLRLPEENRP